MADFISCSNPAYVTMYDMVSPLREGGTFLLNCQWSVEELNDRLPASMKNKLAAKKANFYIINAIDLARKVGMGGRTNTTMQRRHTGTCRSGKYSGGIRPRPGHGWHRSWRRRS